MRGSNAKALAKVNKAYGNNLPSNRDAPGLSTIILLLVLCSPLLLFAWLKKSVIG